MLNRFPFLILNGSMALISVDTDPDKIAQILTSFGDMMSEVGRRAARFGGIADFFEPPQLVWERKRLSVNIRRILHPNQSPISEIIFYERVEGISGLIIELKIF